MPLVRLLTDCLRPLRSAPPALLAGVRGVLTDIDDTLTREGHIEPEALAALHALARAGIPAVAITGRPAGWSEGFALQWPVAAIVAENGAVMLRRRAPPAAGDGPAETLQRDFIDAEPVRQANTLRLQACAAAVLAEVSGATLARDSAGRLTDIAIDHSEFAHLGPDAIDQVVRVMRHHGLTVTVSSIHINGWIGSHSKLSGARWAVEQALGMRFDPADWLFVGDSSNDQVMFEHLPLTVGVANIARFVASLSHLPNYVTVAERGRGFAELAAAVLAAHAGQASPSVGTVTASSAVGSAATMPQVSGPRG